MGASSTLDSPVEYVDQYAGKPRVLIIGDSVSIGYTSPTRNALRTKANVHRIPANGGDTTFGLTHIEQWLGDKPWDVVHFNWGLHDIKVKDDGTFQVPIANYVANIDALVERLEETGAELVWATTTPVPEGNLQPIRNRGDEVAYNAAAEGVMNSFDVRINDLHAFALPQLAEMQIPQNVHFTNEGSKQLGEKVTDEIRAAILEKCLTVTNTDNDGIGSLRYAIACANSFEGPDTITFDISGRGPHTISPLSPLPPIGDSLVIDGTSAPSYEGSPVVELDGTSAGDAAAGLRIRKSAGGSIVRGLAINRFDGGGIVVQSADNNWIEDNHIGTDLTGQFALGNRVAGISIVNTTNTMIRRNLISDNDIGVLVKKTNSTANLIRGNQIGVDVTGKQKLGNQRVGIEIRDAAGTFIGGVDERLRNVISGNTYGIRLTGDANETLIQHNYIGTDSTGTRSIANAYGVFMAGVNGNTVGGDAGAGNLISGNRRSGIFIDRSDDNTVSDNLIGTDVNGTAQLANRRGISIRNGDGNRLGGVPNTISGNTAEGIRILGTASQNTISGNLIGTNRDGSDAIPNRDGILFRGNTSANTIGGVLPSNGNVISGNHKAGVILGGTDNRALGNLIGTNASGVAALPNEVGIAIKSARGIEIGGSDTRARNIISGNTKSGVLITGNSATSNNVTGNFIGTDMRGKNSIPNQIGVAIHASNNVIGGASNGARNVISGNRQTGVVIERGQHNQIKGNLIGIDAAGTLAVPNATGIEIHEGALNVVGGTEPGAGNTISGNSKTGLLVHGGGSNLIEGNKIGTDIDATVTIGNRHGVVLYGSQENVIGGVHRRAGNVISGNSVTGLRIVQPTSVGNRVLGNSFGTSLTGALQLPNRDGVVIGGSASNNTIGGPQQTAENQIANNDRQGIWIQRSAGTGNSLTRNDIHDNGGLGIAVGSQRATSNDVDDADRGANNLQNTPELATAILSDGALIVQYLMSSSAAYSAYPITVEFFVADASGTEGSTFLGDDTIDSPGSVMTSIAAGPATLHGQIVATATDAGGNTSEFSASVNVAAPLLAAVSLESSVQGQERAPALTDAQLSQVSGIAIARLSQLGLGADLFANVSYAIADLPGATLGLAVGNAITIDINAAGYGWALNPQSQIRNPKSIDLLTTVMHELGHVAGLEDRYDEAENQDLMYAWLQPAAQRSSLNGSLADQVFGDI
jgi:parallel beta-helix repeat protein